MFKKTFKLSRLWKKILGITFIVGASSFLLWGSVGIVGQAHATSASSTTNDPLVDKKEVISLVDLALKVIYILLWPLLVIAGMSLDNTLVYGSFLHMDAPLRAFRNIMKNFANFALWFLVLFAILKNIFSFGKDDANRKPQKIITQTLIAGVLIQMSRFVMAALVDLSTIATYAVGALPLNVVSSTPLGKHKIMQVHVEMDLSKFQKSVSSDTNDYFKVSYSVPATKDGKKIPDLKFSECKEKNHYIIGRMDGSTGFRNDGVFWWIKNACVKWGQLVFFNEFPDARVWDDDANYKATLLQIIQEDRREAREACGYVVRVNGPSKNLPEDCATALDDIQTELIANGRPSEEVNNIMRLMPPPWFEPVPFTDWLAHWDNRLQNKSSTAGEPIANALTLDSIVDKSKWFVGPLITMYSSMLDFAQLANTSSDTSFGEITGETLIKTGFAVWLFFPLVALAIVLIIRIWFMRAAIVLSPFLVLLKALNFEDKIKSDFLKKHFSIANVIKVIFAPVVTVFALSISLVFMSTLVASIKTWGTSGFGITKIETSEAWSQMFRTLKDCLELKLDGFEWFGGALDVFSWFLVNMIGIWLMRAIVFAAIKFNSIGEKFGTTVQTFGSNFFKTLPILPLPGGESVGIGSFTSVMWGLPGQKAAERTRTWEEKVKKRVNPEETGSLTTAQTNKITQQILANPNANVVTTTAEVTKVGEEKAAEYFSEANIPTRVAAVEEVEKTEGGKEKAKIVKKALGAKLWKFRYEKRKFTDDLAKVTKLVDTPKIVKTNIDKIKADYALNDTQIEAELANDRPTKVFDDGKTYELSADKNNGIITWFSFKEKSATPWIQ